MSAPLPAKGRGERSREKSSTTRENQDQNLLWNVGQEDGRLHETADSFFPRRQSPRLTCVSPQRDVPDPVGPDSVPSPVRQFPSGRGPTVSREVTRDLGRSPRNPSRASVLLPRGLFHGLSVIPVM